MRTHARVSAALCCGFLLLCLTKTFACSIPMITSRVVPMNDGKHVLVMLFEGVEREPYSVSGLYLKDAPEAPVWKWEGPPLVDAYTIHSDDGRFVVWVILTEGSYAPALRVYESGKFSFELPLDVFVRDETALQRERDPFCGSVAWFREIRLDDSGSRLIAESIEERTVTVELATGEIVEGG